MKILFIEWSSHGREDIKDAFRAEGHSLICFSFSIDEPKLLRHDPLTENRLSSILHKESPDAVFSSNYFPVISRVCQKEHIKYISWTYDSPYWLLYSRTILNSCNVAFVYDKELYREFHNAGISTVHYMPLAVNTERLDMFASSEEPESFAYDVSFVGSLYVEEFNFLDEITVSLSDYAKGYLDALMSAQLKIQGYDFIEEVLAPVMGDLCKAYPLEIEQDSMATREYFFAQYVINQRITAIERIDLLDAVAKRHAVDLFTRVKEFEMSGICNHGWVDYDHEMPMVFKMSKVNLNISRRGIKSGIPLRAFDIMGSGSFLLSNFQPEFLDYFVPGEDFVYYENKEDLLQKIDYYLVHDEERQAIARRGHDKVAADHTYRHRVNEMLAF